MVALHDEMLRLALWPGSRSAANCSARGRALLLGVVDAVGDSVALMCTARPTFPAREHGTLSVFDARVIEVRADTAPYAELEGGIRFRLLEPAQVLERWTRTREALLALGD